MKKEGKLGKGRWKTWRAEKAISLVFFIEAAWDMLYIMESQLESLLLMLRRTISCLCMSQSGPYYTHNSVPSVQFSSYWCVRAFCPFSNACVPRFRKQPFFYHCLKEGIFFTIILYFRRPCANFAIFKMLVVQKVRHTFRGRIGEGDLRKKFYFPRKKSDEERRRGKLVKNSVTFVNDCQHRYDFYVSMEKSNRRQMNI